MNLITIVGILDSDLSREVISMKTSDKNSVSFWNRTGTDLTATVDGTTYSSLMKVCLVSSNTGVFVYLHYSGSFVKLSLESINSFSIA